MCMATKVITSDYKTVVLMNVYLQQNGVSFYPLLVSFCLQITYRKVRNLQIDIDKLVGRLLIKLILHLAKLAACIISIIIDAPAVTYAHG